MSPFCYEKNKFFPWNIFLKRFFFLRKFVIATVVTAWLTGHISEFIITTFDYNHLDWPINISVCFMMYAVCRTRDLIWFSMIFFSHFFIIDTVRSLLHTCTFTNIMISSLLFLFNSWIGKTPIPKYPNKMNN